MNPRLKKFLSFYRPYRRLLWADLACASLVAVITLLLPLGARAIAKALEAGAAPPLAEVYGISAGLVVLVGLHTLGNLFVDYQGHMMGARIEADMRQELFDHLQKLSFAFYDEEKTGRLMSILTNDLFSIAELAHHGPEDLLIGWVKALGVFFILVTISAPLTLAMFLFLPVMGGYAFYFNRKMNATLLESRARIAEVNAQVEESLAGIRVVQSFTNEGLESAKFAAVNGGFLGSRRAGYRSEAIFFGGMIAFTQLLTVAVLFLGSAAIAGGHMDLPDLLTYLLCVGILIEPILRLVNFARLYQEGYTGFMRFMDMLDIAPDIRDAPDARDLPPVKGDITFRAVSFKYRDDHEEVLRDISLHIAAGEYVAFVGTSGAGKTTLCALIPRFYEVSGGAVLLDGVDVRAIRLRALRHHIGVVPQDVYLFAGTVAANIAYGQPGATRAAIMAAAEKAYAHAFIMGLPQGYETEIGQRGIKLSGGQKQRLSIARVFLKDPPVLILDEATSALDPESERAVQASLEALRRDRTTLVVAHRLSTVRHAQRIVVLSASGIEEQGTHAELLAAGGTYAMLYHTQLRL